MHIYVTTSSLLFKHILQAPPDYLGDILSEIQSTHSYINKSNYAQETKILTAHVLKVLTERLELASTDSIYILQR
jgi:hypothetical protein